MAALKATAKKILKDKDAFQDVLELPALLKDNFGLRCFALREPATALPGVCLHVQEGNFEFLSSIVRFLFSCGRPQNIRGICGFVLSRGTALSVVRRRFYDHP